jgi:hypothetical protein
MIPGIRGGQALYGALVWLITVFMGNAVPCRLSSAATSFADLSKSTLIARRAKMR